MAARIATASTVRFIIASLYRVMTTLETLDASRLTLDAGQTK
jgi:hypothetical protein